MLVRLVILALTVIVGTVLLAQLWSWLFGRAPRQAARIDHRTSRFTLSHALVALVGLAAGIYLLSNFLAPRSPPAIDVAAIIDKAEFKGQFRRDLKGSDYRHWGEGTISVSQDFIALQGEISPGPDYKLYLSPEFVETKADFVRLKPQMVQVGDVDTFENFIVPIPRSIDPSAFNTVIVWCESFSAFITAANYK